MRPKASTIHCSEEMVERQANSCSESGQGGGSMRESVQITTLLVPLDLLPLADFFFLQDVFFLFLSPFCLHLSV